MKYKAYAATMQSVWFSDDEGASWNRLLTPWGGFYNEARAFSICTHDQRPGELLAGTDQGLYRYTEQTGRFDYLPSPMENLHILQMAQDPLDANFIVCGTRPGELFFSEDNGVNWTRANLDASTECWFINTSRLTSVHFDPRDRDTLWITIEIDGILKSTDRGRTWELIIRGLHDNDTHDLVFRDYDDGSRAVLCSTEDGIHRSDDNGSSWRQLDIPVAKWPYSHRMKQHLANPDIVMCSVSDKPSGTTGQIIISHDFGQNWQEASLDAGANSTIWTFAANAADPSLLFAATIFGNIFKSTDGGEHWQKLERELGEIRQIAWAPQ